MIYFRCYNCWTSLKSGSKDDYDECPECGRLLFVGPIGETIEAAIVNPQEKQEHDNF